MAKRSGLVHKPKEAQASLTPAIPLATHQAVVDTCTDVPEMEPAFPLPLNSVGISSKTVWIQLPQGTLPFEAEIMTDLPGRFRGIHMSRMEHAISALFDKPFDDIRNYSERLCQLVLSGQKGSQATVSIKGKIPLVTRTSVSNEISTESVDIYTNTLGDKAGGQIETFSTIGLSITHITACPCTQVYNAACFKEADNHPMPTHSQRCTTTLWVEDQERKLSFSHLYDCLKACLHISQDLLKRPDEAELVLKSHEEPQFVEDVVRLAAFEAARQFEGLISGNSKIVIEAESLESIHQHNVKCELACTLSEILEKVQY